MPTNSAVFTELYAPGLRKVIFESYKYMASEYGSFLRVGSSARQYEEDYKMGGFGAVPEKPEGSPITYDDPVPGSKVQYYWKPYGKGFRVTHEAQSDELYGQMKKMAAALGKAFRNQGEIIGASMLNNAFKTPATIGVSSNYGYDAKALCATDHPLLRGGSVRNRPSGDIDLSVTALQDAIVDFERVVDESSVPIVLIPRKIVVAPELWPLLQEILRSTQKPFTSDNEVNILSGALDPFMSHYMTDTNAWFIETAMEDLDLWFFWREKFSTDASDDFDTGDGKMKGYMRGDIGYGDFRGIWGSPGSS